MTRFSCIQWPKKNSIIIIIIEIDGCSPSTIERTTNYSDERQREREKNTSPSSRKDHENLTSGLPRNVRAGGSSLIDHFAIGALMKVVAKHDDGDDQSGHHQRRDDIDHEGSFRPENRHFVTFLPFELSNAMGKVTADETEGNEEKIENRPNPKRRNFLCRSNRC